MTIELSTALADARTWLEKEPSVEPGSAHWYALNNFRTFLADIDADPSAEGIARACHALNSYIADQFEWSAQYSKEISFFCEGIRMIGKAIGRAEANGTPPPYVRSVAPGGWILKDAHSLLGELHKAPAVVTTEHDEINLQAITEGDEAGAIIAEFLRNLGLPFFADREWSPVAYVKHLKREGLISGRFTEIYWTVSGRWRLRDIE